MYIIKKLGISLLFISSLLFTFNSKVNAQNYLPFNYWTFDASNSMDDSMNHNSLNPTFYNSPYSISNGNSGSAVGRNLILTSASKMIVATSPLILDTGITIEFLFKAGTDINQTVQFFNKRDGAIQIRLGYATIKFLTSVIPFGGSALVNDNFSLDLRGVGRGSFGYYIDGNWHHLVFRYNATTGIKEVWVDGECPDDFKKTIPGGKFAANASNTNNNILDLNTNTDYYRFNGSIDEIAIYKFSLHENLIYKHYNEFKQNKHYTFNYTSVVPPTAALISAGIDPMEYAPGHPIVNVSAIDQLKSFPSPRYKPGNTLFPNVPIFNPGRLSGFDQPNVARKSAVELSKLVQKEMVTVFNYTLVVSSNTGHGGLTDTTTFEGAWIAMSNQNPSWKTSAISYWDQIRPVSSGFSSNDAYISCRCLPDDSYLRNTQNQFLDRNGNVVSYKILSPETTLDSMIQDGKTQKTYLTNLTNALNRPLDLLFENAEVITHWTEAGLTKDPNVLANKNASGLDWQKYIGRKMKGIASSYIDQYRTLPKLSSTWIQHYELTAHPSNWDWSETRSLMTQRNGIYHSTGDIYLQWPFAWLDGSGMAKGWEDLIDQRYEEINMGDKLFSPVVSPGWSYDEERIVRPAQWLGFLKTVAITGVENFETGYFSEVVPPQLPENYVWQVSTPSYVQALISRYEDLLRNGYLMDGDVPARVTGQTGLPGYQFYAGDVRKLVSVRKHNTQNKYVIAGTIQNNSNMIGNAELNGVASINLEGQQLQFNIRRQGSTYIYDNTNPASPVFYQLDGWHESTHPSYWSKAFDLEAELFDNNPANVVIKTDVPTGTASYDFTNFTSYIGFSASSTVQFNVQPRGDVAATHYLWVLARSVDGTNTGFTVSLDGAQSNSVNCITDQNWRWYCFEATDGQPITYNNLSIDNHVFTFSNINNKLEVDRITLTPQSGAYYPNAVSPCPTNLATAVITPMGTTTFCQGGNVTLTANPGSTYLWTTGATTQSISVNATGSYGVRVYVSNLNFADANPIVVSVGPLPSSGINASGPLTFCSGDSVTLEASEANASYLWSPGGETTSSIIVKNSGSYNLIITNNAACSVSSQTISVTSITSANLPSSITTSGSTTFCDGGSVTLTANSGSDYAWSNGETTQSINATTNGNYTVTVGVNGCLSLPSPPINVKVNPRATFTVLESGPLSFCNGSSVTLSIQTSNNPSAYIWYKDSKVITSIGTHATSYEITTPGDYAIRVQLGACGKFSSNYKVTMPCRAGETLGITQFDAFAYPNPFEDRTTISLFLLEAQKISINIYDMNGRMVANVADGVDANEGSNSFTYNKSDLGKGIFFAVITAGKETRRIKIASLN